MNPNQLPDLHWKLANTYHTTNIGQSETGCTTVSVHNITVKTFSYAMGNRCIEWCKINLLPVESKNLIDTDLDY